MLGTSRFTRYVLSELGTPTMLGLVLYTFVLLMNHFFLVAEKALAKNLGFELTARLFLNGIPNLLVLSIPMSVILGSLIGVGRLSADHEWVALQGAGQGPRRLLWPLVIHGLVWSIIAFLMYGYVAPRSNYALRNLRGELLMADNLAADLKPRVFYTDLPDSVLFVDEIRAGTKGRLEGVLLVRENRDDGSTTLALARSGDIYPSKDGSGRLLLDLYDGVGSVYWEDSPDDTYRYSTGFRQVTEEFEPQEYMRGLLEPPVKVVQDYTPPELLDEYRKARAALDQIEQKIQSGAGKAPSASRQFLAQSRVNRVVIEINQRLALPLTSLFFAVLALPLGITRVRSGKGAGFAMSLLVILVYWVSFTLARDQALLGKFPAVLGPWAGNIVIIPWAAWGLWRMTRAPSQRAGPLSYLYWQAGNLVRDTSKGVARLHQKLVPPAVQHSENGDADAIPLEDMGGTTTHFVGRLDRYIGKYFLRILVFAISSAYLVYALVESKTLMDGLLRTGQPFSLMLSFYPYFVPSVLYIVLPISCLIAAVVTFTLLTRSGELTAIKSSGLSMRRVTVSVLVLSAMISGLLFLVQDRIAPGTNKKAQEIRDQIIGRAPRTHAPAMGRWGFAKKGGHLYHYRVFDPVTDEFQGVNVFTVDRRAPRIIDHRFAERARWTGSAWELEGGWYRTFDSDNPLKPWTIEHFEHSTMAPLDSPEELVSKQRRIHSADDLSEQMSSNELSEQIRSLQSSGYDTTRLRVAYHAKIAHSLTPFVMVLLGLPFAFKVGRRGSLYGIGVAFLLVLVYWAVLAVFNALGLETILEPRVAAWAPNVLFGLLGFYLLLYVKT